MGSEPAFGQPITNNYASDDNPHKHCLFVRSIKRSGKVNPGWHWLVTDGKGEFWETSPAACTLRANTTPITPEVRERCKLEAKKRWDALGPWTRTYDKIDEAIDAAIQILQSGGGDE